MAAFDPDAMEYEVESIMDDRPKHRHDGRVCGKSKKRNIRDYLVKWVGDDKPTWEPESNLVGIEVFETYKKQKVA